ncbi:MAG TPA: hypothetical protein VF466_02295 [Candidatus Saccharimonadales bacterium]
MVPLPIPSVQAAHLAAAQRAVRRATHWVSVVRLRGGPEDDIANGVLAAAADRALDRAARQLHDADDGERSLVDEHGVRLHARLQSGLGAAALDLQPELEVPRANTFDGMVGRVVEGHSLNKWGRPRDAYAMLQGVPGRAGFIRAYRRATLRTGEPPLYGQLVREMTRHGALHPWQVAEGFEQAFGGDYDRLGEYARWQPPAKKRPAARDKASKQQTYLYRGRLARTIEPRLSVSAGQPRTWADVAQWYEDTHHLRQVVHESLDEQGRAALMGLAARAMPEGVPLSVWSQYFEPNIARPHGPELTAAFVRIKVPRVTLARAAALEAEFRPDRPFLCFIGDRQARTGNPDVDAVALGGWDIGLLNLLMIGELRTGRPVGRERLLVHTGLTPERLDRFLSNLVIKLRGPATPGIRPAAADTIIRVSGGKKDGPKNPHYRINPRALVLDARAGKASGQPQAA